MKKLAQMQTIPEWFERLCEECTVEVYAYRAEVEPDPDGIELAGYQKIVVEIRGPNLFSRPHTILDELGIEQLRVASPTWRGQGVSWDQLVQDDRRRREV